ncbi:MAG: BamA/TamA family outer membrane protein [Flavobacteriales bacterium]|nr:BamA/TamA family outer membrane protein [Flavobacteriales bacterium]MCB9203520.1 BamA/TamA family outer membrane protein [Flavobacteriales bacterium]
MTSKPSSWLLLLTLAIVAASCSPTRKLAEGEFLLTKNVIENDSKVVSKGDLESFLRQKPNRRVFGFYRFHLQVYNLVNHEKLEERVQVLTEKNAKRNAKRKLKGKEPKERRRSFWEWLEDIGEEPVIYDALTSEKSAEQLEIYLKGKGHFNASVSDTVEFNPKRKKAKAIYTVNSGTPYKVRKLNYRIEDNRLSRLIKPARGREIILRDGMNYDVEKFQEERERIERNLKSNGYYAFSDDYVRLEVDTNLNSHQADITITIAKPQVADTSKMVSDGHQTYMVRNIYVHTDYDQKKIGKVKYDTLVYNGVHFIYEGEFKHRPEMLLDKIFFKTGDLYRIKRGELTYRYLSSLRAYKFINLAYTEHRNANGKMVLDCHINLTPGLRQAYAIELQGTNTEGNLGVSGSFIYKNKNLFRGAEILQFKITGGLESQVVASNIENQNINGVLPFNTIEVNPEISLIFPKLLVPFRPHRIVRYGDPKSIISVGYNYQQRPDYTRSIFNAKFGYQWMQNQNARHFLNPLEVNFVNIYNEAPAFRERINSLRDKLLVNTFSPHLTTTTNYTYIFSNQRVNKKGNFSYFKARLESSGNILRGIMALAQAEKDTNNSYRIFNVPFSQYLKYEVDYRKYWQVTNFSQLVFRVNQGIGFPLLNLGVLPFESAFFGGGANGIRAWSARSLGPGSLPDSLNLQDQFGDIKLEINLEYRFDIYRWFKGALFADAGNVWLIKKDEDRPGGLFEFKDFYKELALGAGVGIRLDFSFFIIRFDVATPFHDPGRPVNDRWAIKDFEWSDVNLNLGIGYPF